MWCSFLPFLFFQLGKSVVAKVNLKKGETLTADKLAVKVAEPRGIPAEDIFDVLNKTVLEDVEEDETIMPDVVENYCKKTKCWRRQSCEKD